MIVRQKQGYNIICSRYYFSNYAFQSEYVPIDWLVNCNSLCKSYLKPDFIFYLNVDPEECNRRITTGRVDIEIYENLEKLTKSHEEFLKTFDTYGEDESIHIIDGSRSIEEIHDDIWSITKSQLAATINQ